jgi:hypothetical protein
MIEVVNLSVREKCQHDSFRRSEDEHLSLEKHPISQALPHTVVA